MFEELEPPALWEDRHFYLFMGSEQRSDIEATIGPDMLGMITCDPMQVDEIDWADVAKAAI